MSHSFLSDHLDCNFTSNFVIVLIGWYLCWLLFTFCKYISKCCLSGTEFNVDFLFSMIIYIELVNDFGIGHKPLANNTYHIQTKAKRHFLKFDAHKNQNTIQKSIRKVIPFFHLFKNLKTMYLFFLKFAVK